MLAKTRWGGARLFVSTGPLIDSRIGRFKYLEIEALTNTRMTSNLMVCAYDMTLGGRSFRNQAADCHVFIANNRSIRRNPDFMHPSEALVNPDGYKSSAGLMADGQAGEVSVRILPGEVTVTLVKRYLTSPPESPLLYLGPEEGG